MLKLFGNVAKESALKWRETYAIARWDIPLVMLGGTVGRVSQGTWLSAACWDWNLRGSTVRVLWPTPVVPTFTCRRPPFA